MSDSLWPHELSSGVCSNSCPLSRWCHPTILSSITLFSSCPQPFPASVFSNELAFLIRWPKYWSYSFNISPSNEYSGLIFFRTDWFDLLAVLGTLKILLQHHSLKASILQHSVFFMFQLGIIQFSSVAQSCPRLCDPMAYSMPGFPVHYQLPELPQTHVHWVCDAIQTSCPLLLLPSTFPSIRVFSNPSALHFSWPKYCSFSFSVSPSNEYSGFIFFRID